MGRGAGSEQLPSAGACGDPQRDGEELTTPAAHLRNEEAWVFVIQPPWDRVTGAATMMRTQETWSGC